VVTSPARLLLKPEAWLSLLLRRVRRGRISFAGNCVLGFPRFGFIEILIGRATGENHRSAGEKNQAQGFHGYINNKDIKTLQAG
jgi:hypothetical protein